jgi:hypothetical protein
MSEFRFFFCMGFTGLSCLLLAVFSALFYGANIQLAIVAAKKGYDLRVKGKACAMASIAYGIFFVVLCLWRWSRSLRAHSVNPFTVISSRRTPLWAAEEVVENAMGPVSPSAGVRSLSRRRPQQVEEPDDDRGTVYRLSEQRAGLLGGLRE